MLFSYLCFCRNDSYTIKNKISHLIKCYFFGAGFGLNGAEHYLRGRQLYIATRQFPCILWNPKVCASFYNSRDEAYGTIQVLEKRNNRKVYETKTPSYQSINPHRTEEMPEHKENIVTISTTYD
jgi:hypothetical protein